MKNIKEKCSTIKSKISKGEEKWKSKLSNSSRCETKQRLEENKIKYKESLEKLDEQLEDDKVIEDKKINGCVSLAPTNLAALIIDGITIHKFACLIKSYDVLHAMNLKYVFVDTVSMLQEKFYKFLLALKKLKPEIKFIISGDYSQLMPVCDRISPKYDYSLNPALFELCDFNMIQLTTRRRANNKLFNLIKYDNVSDLTPEDFTPTSNITDYNVHLCYTNERRIKINNVMMTHKATNYEGNKIDISKLFWDTQSQDVTLQIDTPIIAKINNIDLGIVNNERFKITDIKKNMITITNEFKKSSLMQLKTMHFNDAFGLHIAPPSIAVKGFLLVRNMSSINLITKILIRD